MNKKQIYETPYPQNDEELYERIQRYVKSKLINSNSKIRADDIIQEVFLLHLETEKRKGISRYKLAKRFFFKKALGMEIMGIRKQFDKERLKKSNRINIEYKDFYYDNQGIKHDFYSCYDDSIIKNFYDSNYMDSKENKSHILRYYPLNVEIGAKKLIVKMNEYEMQEMFKMTVDAAFIIRDIKNRTKTMYLIESKIFVNKKDIKEYFGIKKWKTIEKFFNIEKIVFSINKE